MKKILKNWKHIPGVHCGSVAVRDVMNYYSLRLTEEICFGLGAGLGFYYSRNSSTPSRSIHVRGPWMEAGFFNHFGFELEDWKYEEDSEKAHIFLKESIDNEIPVMIQTDIFYLDYYNSGTHFPGHIVVVCGYDDEKEVFYLSDTSFNALQEVSFYRMKEARNSKHLPYPLSNNYLDININTTSLDLKEAAAGAIIMNAEYMKNGTETLRGRSGIEVIKSWADELPEWKYLEDWKWSSRFAYQVINRRGVDGAAFRWIYRDFLKEIKDYCPAVERLDLVSDMDNIGLEWSEISFLLKEISEMEYVTNQFEKASQIADNIFILERDFYNKVIEKSGLI